MLSASRNGLVVNLPTRDLDVRGSLGQLWMNFSRVWIFLHSHHALRPQKYTYTLKRCSFHQRSQWFNLFKKYECSKTCLKQPLKIDKTKVLKINDS